MPMFLDTRGRSTLGIGICARCSEKFSLDELHPDPNAPGLRVCRDDLDDLDPYRLPARETEDITLEYPRPDVSLVPGPYDVPVNPIQAILSANGVGLGTGVGSDVLAIAPPATPILPSVVWTPNTQYGVGAQVTAFNPVGLAAAGLDIYVYLCVIPGISGATAPNWPAKPGVEITDNQVFWLNIGVYLP